MLDLNSHIRYPILLDRAGSEDPGGEKERNLNMKNLKNPALKADDKVLAE